MKPPALITEDVLSLGQILREGGLVVFPTETVYGIGASSLNFESCLRIYQIKNRPSDNPLIAHFSEIEEIDRYCILTSEARSLLEKFSPGPISLVLNQKGNSLFPPDRKTIAVRIPSHEKARELIRASGSPISAPSANISGKPSLTRRKDVIDTFQFSVEGILLGEDPEIGIESTVVDMTGNPPVLLRPGKIRAEEIKQLIPDLVLPSSVSENVLPQSPGMKYRHYSPEAEVRIVSDTEFESSLRNANETQGLTFEGKKTAWIGFSFSKLHSEDVILSSNEEYMKELYAFFVEADKRNIELCLCQEPKKDGHYLSLMNRLEKAASKR
ncbi:L-threonylcarbamoyladenylate synthase [Leptospira idonii]|uniref:Threonylcarbamoyl-AMP synthase n=1 Tax=Leptospira idonii TaxID=1193500 RepID=A0A4R9LYZ9_9LEPT|nr:L-threonylcarbamoyladenylate synthase [Leptospira idonii]TGN18695.1 threonylcarbamoyl-AMP synthase [Leptospira idonii]